MNLDEIDADPQSHLGGRPRPCHWITRASLITRHLFTLVRVHLLVSFPHVTYLIFDQLQPLFLYHTCTGLKESYTTRQHLHLRYRTAVRAYFSLESCTRSTISFVHSNTVKEPHASSKFLYIILKQMSYLCTTINVSTLHPSPQMFTNLKTMMTCAGFNLADCRDTTESTNKMVRVVNNTPDFWTWGADRWR